jgi:hypothetical protein
MKSMLASASARAMAASQNVVIYAAVARESVSR